MKEIRTIRAVAVGASAGGVESLSKWVSLLDPRIQFPIFVVMHFPQTATSALPHILSRAGRIPAKHAEEGEIATPGTIYIAPPGKHLLIQSGKIQLSRGPKENGHRPAIDPLFRSVGSEFGSGAMGILLSGLLDDGTLGMAFIKDCGGLTAVQDPQDALFGDMPRNAIEAVDIDHVLPVEELAALTNAFGLETDAGPGTQCSEDPIDPTKMDMTQLRQLDRETKPSIFTCPECHGTLFEFDENGVIQFRCRVGHAYTSASLASEQEEALEAALWAGLRALEENISLLRRLHSRALRKGHEVSARIFQNRVDEGKKRAEVLHQFLLEWNANSNVS